MKAWKTAGFAAVLCCAAFQQSGAALAAERSCESLAELAIADLRVTKAETIDPDPKWDYPPSVFNSLAPPGAGVEVPFCRVAGVIETEIRFELWLPADWNGKFQGVGNGGLSGALNYPAMGTAIDRGYATASTDTGHRTPDNMFGDDWIEGHPERLVNFGHRAHHLMAQVSKEIVAAYYGEEAEYAYFNGCSSGGWQGLTEAQKYPDDYDAIIAGAPAHDYVRLQANIILLEQLRRKRPEGNLSEAQAQLLVDAAVAKCDPADGVADGLISDPLGCDFDPADLQCPADGEENCLSPAQVERARFLYGPRSTEDGLRLYPGPAYGTMIRAGGPGTQTADDTALAKSLKEKPSWDVMSFDPDRHIPAMEKELAEDMSAMNPDLTEFREKGGKIIVYHGWLDPGISPYHSIQYYESVAAVLGDDAMDDFYRMFFVPGMGHCGGGPGPNVFDTVTPLEAWAEKGVAPERIEAAHSTDGEVDRTRPLCPFPEIARYDGSGSTDAAENFVCAAP